MSAIDMDALARPLAKLRASLGSVVGAAVILRRVSDELDGVGVAGKWAM